MIKNDTALSSTPSIDGLTAALTTSVKLEMDVYVHGVYGTLLDSLHHILPYLDAPVYASHSNSEFKHVVYIAFSYSIRMQSQHKLIRLTQNVWNCCSATAYKYPIYVSYP